jgi:putative membrane protein
MHPFYGPNNQLLGQENTLWLGLASMMIYILFWAVVVLFAVNLIKKYIIRPDSSKVQEDTAMSILRERYARGEIEAEEFKQKKADLDHSS